MPKPINKKTHGAFETKRISFLESKLAPSESDSGVMEFSGYGAVFGNIDSYGDVIEKGAFSGYLADVASGKQEWPAMLSQHGGWGGSAIDLTPVGVYSDQKEDELGLKVTGVLAETPRGLELNTLMKMKPRPAISGLSIGYYVREFAYGGKSDPYERLLKQIDLVEISIVTFPANGKARVSGVKSDADYNDREFEKLMQDAGFSRKEARIIMNMGFRHLKVTQDADREMIKELASAIKNNTQFLIGDKHE